jgi:hypothetical protein
MSGPAPDPHSELVLALAGAGRDNPSAHAVRLHADVALTRLDQFDAVASAATSTRDLLHQLVDAIDAAGWDDPILRGFVLALDERLAQFPADRILLALERTQGAVTALDRQAHPRSVIPSLATARDAIAAARPRPAARPVPAT